MLCAGINMESSQVSASGKDITTDREEAANTRPGIWQLAFPSILGNLSFTIVGLTQIRVVGELGTDALAAGPG